MKKSAIPLFLIFILFCPYCSLFRAKVVPYPTGVIFPVTGDHELSYEGEVISPVRRQDHLIYFSTRNGKVYCADVLKKEIQWKVELSASISSAPILAGTRMYVIDTDSTLYCVDLLGNLLYKITFQNKISSGIGASDERVFIGTEGGLFSCMNAESGQVLWQFQAEDTVRSNPVLWQDRILFGCDDHHIYVLDKNGMLANKIDVGGKTGKTLAVDDGLLYFGTDDRILQCMILSRQKIKWKVRSGGATYMPPVVSGKRIFFLCWNCVLYCLNKKNGAMFWWNSVPSRSFYRAEVIDRKVVVSSLSPELVCFDVQTGESQGRFSAPQEIKSNPLWLSPFLVVNLYDPDSDTGKLLYLKKEVKATISSSKRSPRKQNEEITFSAKDAGFHLPKYEFFLTPFALARFHPGLFFPFPIGEKKTVQVSSEESTWNWFPEGVGIYLVDVEVTDEKEKARASMPFVIQERIVDISLVASLESPQKIGQEIVFTVKTSGAIRPQFEFHLVSLKWVVIPSGLSLLYLEKDEVVQESSNLDSWKWNPDKEGSYLIRIHMQDEQETATTQMAYAVIKE